ncbi:MAG: hypothetical protein ABIJ61_12100 [bacterium]
MIYRILNLLLIGLLLLLASACSDPATDPSDELKDQLKAKNPNYSGQLRYNYDRRCELPCWSYFVDTVPVAFDFTTIGYIGAQVTAWGPWDTTICNGTNIGYIFADSVVFEQADSQLTTLTGRIIPQPYYEYGCNSYRFTTDCDTFDFQLKEDLLDTLEDNLQPLTELVGYLVELSAQYWDKQCHNRLAVIAAIGIEEERAAVGRLYQCDSTLPGCGGDYVLVGRNTPENWLGVYSLESASDLYEYLFADSIAVWGWTVYPKPFASNYPVLGLDSLRVFLEEPIDCVLVIRGEKARK